MLIQIIILFVALLILPGYFIYELWTGKEASKFKWLMKVLYSSVFVIYILLTGRWDWLSYYFPVVWVILLAAAVIVSYWKIRALPFFIHEPRRDWREAGSYVFTLLVFLGFLIFTVRGFFYSEEPVHLTFPLRDGRYYVGQGGNSSLLNYHNTNPAQQYALDIVALNAVGRRALGIYSSDVNQYQIFGQKVYSPCDGTVVESVDNLPDLVPPETDREHPAGNHVVITCQGVNVALAHLQNGSVAVQTGETVKTGQLLGQVGNSGNTTEPHLHIHAIRAEAEDILKGDGVPILFDGKFLVRNAVFMK